MSKDKANRLTAQEKVEHYLNIWGSDKRTLMSILRQVILIIGIIASTIVGVWVILHAISFYFNNDTFSLITDRVSKISIVFIAFIIVLDGMYIFFELRVFNKTRMNRLPSLIIGIFMQCILITFFIMTCVELFAIKDTTRSYIYCIYLVICFSCCLYSTIFCFDAKQKNVKFNPNRRLLKSLSYTIGFLGIFAVLTFILWIMWYATGNDQLSWTCFILARTVITLIGSIIVKLVCQIVLIFVMKHNTNYSSKRLVYLIVILAILFGLELWLGWCFLLHGPWQTQISLCKAAMTVTIIFVIAISAIDIAIASKYAVALTKEDN